MDGPTAGAPVPAGAILILDKPLGMTSHAVVARVRKHLGLRRVGHAGTLDPDATGVLVVGVGSATRLLGYLAGDDKEYATTIVLGMATTTDDAAGDVLWRGEASDLAAPDGSARVARAAADLTGPIRQRPSAVSAIKVDGKRAYDRVRDGEDVVLPERPVTVHSFEIGEIRRRDDGCVEVDAVVSCSSGTYIRALARDMGQALGVGGHVLSLRRTRSGAFTVAEATPLDDLAAARLLSPGEAATRSLPWLAVSDDQAHLVRNGVRIEWPTAEHPPPEATVALMYDGDLVALARCENSKASYAAVFLGA